MRPSIAPPLVVVVLKGYPRVSETFIAHELAALERRGSRSTSSRSGAPTIA